MKKSGEKAKREKGEKEKSQNPPLITAQAVKAALWELGATSAMAVADCLQVQTYKERFRVKQILAALVRTGEAALGGPPEVTTYRLTGKSGRGGVQAKLWEFACLRFATAKPFGVAEAARLAECDRDYTKRYYRWLWKSGYLAIVSRGKANVVFYQVVGGKEHGPAPQWNRRAEKRKRSVGETPAPPVSSQKEIPPSPPLVKGGDEPAAPRTILWDETVRAQAAKLDAALEEFGAALVEVAGGIERAWEIIREMKGELLAIGETCHDEPGEPTAGGH